MSFDNSTRNRLQRLVSDCRDLLTCEFDAKLKELYGIYSDEGRVLDLEKLTNLDDEKLRVAALLRERINHLASGGGGTSAAVGDAVKRVLREQAFTVLNRFAALRMAEERGIIVESVGGGLNSKGFKTFSEVAYSGLGSAYERYRVFLGCMFDELTTDLGVLFDRQSPFGLLFPRENVLLEVFELLNAPEVKPLWKEDETVGWIYQYFNDPVERKKMRELSAAPRNSRELAVRNQFFTPRYVVEFLTDNTLGRIWYEMMGGATSVKERCRYLVRRPNEVFLKPGEDTPPKPKQDNLSQEELLKQPVFIPHRPIKDPRTILMLDPACGSMHFGLYAFDLYEMIYDEAWEQEGATAAPSLARPAEMKSLRETFATKEDFLRQVPRLIIEHNLHGIDIDPRCAQIAGLSLWLRAQKSWQRLGLKPAERPPIRRSNIVCAEPMPGEKELLREFVEKEFPTAERGVFLQLLETIFDKMQLAGEAGSLLKIEEEISSAIEAARAAWQKLQTRPSELFSTGELNAVSKQSELDAAADLRLLTSDFFERVEERIYAALRDYAEQAENGGGFQRRLFAEDAARGFAFIDVCRKRYDAALMNPPFGECSTGAKDYLEIRYPGTKHDVFAAFIERWIAQLQLRGSLGAITSRTGLFLSSFQYWREELLLRNAPPSIVADLGYGVLDSAMVEAAAYCLSANHKTEGIFLRLLHDEDKDKSLQELLSAVSRSEASPNLFVVLPDEFSKVPTSPFCYSAGTAVTKLFGKFPQTQVNDIRVCEGLNTTDNDRFLRLYWEVLAQNVGRSGYWVLLAKGGEYAEFYSDLHLVVKWENDGQELKTLVRELYGSETKRVYGQPYYFRAGITYSQRTQKGLSFRCLPKDSIFNVKGPGVFAAETNLPTMLGILNSSTFKAMVELQTAFGSYNVGYLQRTPFPHDALQSTEAKNLGHLAIQAVNLKRGLAQGEETEHVFYVPALAAAKRNSLHQAHNEFQSRVTAIEDEIAVIREQTDFASLSLYGLRSADLSGLSECKTSEVGSLDSSQAESSETEAVGSREITDGSTFAISYFVGSAFGRWDIRYATGDKAAPELPDPFAPLPVCPPGQLQNAQGLPARPEDVPAAYPVRIPWDGILVDDPNHPLDIERCVREVIEIIWTGSAGGPTAEAIEHEACEILDVKSLRDYFRKPAGFFADHLKRYSKSRRQAPIYWPLSTASGSYTLWIYYHRLTDQTLFQCVNDFVKPKITEVEGDLSRLTTTGSDKPGARAEIERLTILRAELIEFRDELLRVAQLPYKPNLNDGVLIAASPLWKLFRLPKWQKDLKACWTALENEEYEWAHLAYTLWPDRVKAVCKKDHSIAIAHGLEELCDVKAPEKKAKKKKKEQMEMEEDSA
jgi:hypothetical protein